MYFFNRFIAWLITLSFSYPIIALLYFVGGKDLPPTAFLETCFWSFVATLLVELCLMS